MNIILASTSKIRRSILSNAGIDFSAVDPEIDEAKAKASMPEFAAQKVALELAKLKSLKISSQNRTALVIGADQVLGFNNCIFNKPASRIDAEKQLLELRNATHTLYAAISCSINGVEKWNHCAEAHLTMRNFTPDFLLHYLGGNPENYLSSVGGYKLEETGIQLFEKVEGDYFAILGLPMLPLLDFLREQKTIPS